MPTGPIIITATAYSFGLFTEICVGLKGGLLVVFDMIITQINAHGCNADWQMYFNNHVFPHCFDVPHEFSVCSLCINTTYYFNDADVLY